MTAICLSIFTHRGTVLRRALTDITLAEAGGEGDPPRRTRVERAAFHRGYATSGLKMAQAADNTDL